MLAVSAGGRGEVSDFYRESREEVEISGRDNWDEAKTDRGCPPTGSWAGPAEAEEEEGGTGFRATLTLPGKGTRAKNLPH